MGIIFTRRCILCRKPLPATETTAFLCVDCVPKLEQYRLHPASIHIKGADGAAAALKYKKAVQRAMLGFKFHHKPSYAKWFIAQTLPILADNIDIWRPDLVTFAPIGWMRYHKRGYNQSELLAVHIAKAFGLPCQNTLKKRFFSRKQSRRKNVEARWKNAEKMFLPRKNVDLTGRRLLFVDDIITTGATATAAVRLLREMGAEHVYVIVPTKS